MFQFNKYTRVLLSHVSTRFDDVIIFCSMWNYGCHGDVNIITTKRLWLLWKYCSCSTEAMFIRCHDNNKAMDTNSACAFPWKQRRYYSFWQQRFTYSNHWQQNVIAVVAIAIRPLGVCRECPSYWDTGCGGGGTNLKLKGQFTFSVSINAAIMLVTLLSLKMELLQNGLHTHAGATSLYSMREVSLA